MHVLNIVQVASTLATRRRSNNEHSAKVTEIKSLINILIQLLWLAAISKGFAGLGSPKINQDIIRDLRESGLHDLHDNWGLSTEGYRPAGTSVQRLDLDDGMRSGAGQGKECLTSEHSLRRDATLQISYVYSQRAVNRRGEGRRNGIGILISSA